MNINSLEVKDKGWWVFQKNYSLTNDNKKKLTINWNKDVFFKSRNNHIIILLLNTSD